MPRMLSSRGLRLCSRPVLRMSADPIQTAPPESSDRRSPQSSPPESDRPASSSAPPPPGDGSLIWKLGGIVLTVRPHQWVKNVFVLAPIVFAKEIFDPLLITRAASAFLIFCLLAGAVYTI